MEISERDLGRNSPKEQERIGHLLEIIPEKEKSILEIGARDGYVSERLRSYFEKVVALDLTIPRFDHKGVVKVQGNVISLPFSDNSFNTVLCSEVLEHIPARSLQTACNEIVRVSKRNVIIGVPFEQENRMWRTTCLNCGGKNPPYGHVNTFSIKKLEILFKGTKLEKSYYVGREKKLKTNWLSVALMDISGNRHGTYDQEETCIHCNQKLIEPSKNASIFKKVFSRSSVYLMKAQNLFNGSKLKPIWIHLVLSKK